MTTKRRKKKALIPIRACMLLSAAAHMPLLAQQNGMHDSNPTAFGKRVEYDLYIDHLMVNYSDKSKMGMAINGSILGPVLHFTEGDTAMDISGVYYNRFFISVKSQDIWINPKPNEYSEAAHRRRLGLYLKKNFHLG